MRLTTPMFVPWGTIIDNHILNKKVPLTTDCSLITSADTKNGILHELYKNNCAIIIKSLHSLTKYYILVDSVKICSNVFVKFNYIKAINLLSASSN